MLGLLKMLVKGRFHEHTKALKRIITSLHNLDYYLGFDSNEEVGETSGAAKEKAPTKEKEKEQEKQKEKDKEKSPELPLPAPNDDEPLRTRVLLHIVYPHDK